MISIQNRSQIFEKLQNLDRNDLPLFGKMNPHEMIEHLAFCVQFSNGKNPQKNYYPGREVEIKNLLLNTGKFIPEGLKAPMLEEDKLPHLRFETISEAIQDLQNELTYFDEYFSKNPKAMPIHPAMGALTHQEWIIWHNQHFIHHFRQFNLI